MCVCRRLSSLAGLLALAVSISVVITACSSGGGDAATDEIPTANLTSSDIKVIDANGYPTSPATLVIGHPFTVELGITSEETAEAVSADFYIVDREGFDAPVDSSEEEEAVELKYYHLGSAFLGDLSAGENTRTAEIVIPYTTEDLDDEGNVVYGGVVLDAQRDYYLFADIDPANQIEEYDEEDNRPTDENLDRTMVIVDVDPTWKDTPNLVLESILLEVPAFEIADPDEEVEVDSCGNEIIAERPVDQEVSNPHIGVTASINATGRYWPTYPYGRPAPIPRVDVQATLTTPGLVAFGEIPVVIWDSVAQDYSDTLSIYDIEPGTPMSVSLDMRLFSKYLDSEMLRQLVYALADDASACFSSCDLDRSCFIGQIQDGTYCDEADLLACGGSISGIPPDVVVTDPDWGCYVERIDGFCLSQCNPDLNCIYDCTQEFVNLEVRITAFDEYGAPINEYESAFIIDNNVDAELVLLPAPDPGPPAPTDPVLFESGFDKSFSAKLIYAGLSANAWAGLDTSGAYTGLEAAVPVVLFRGSPSSCNPDTQDCLLGYVTSEIFLGVRSTIAAVPTFSLGDNIAVVDIYAFGQNLLPKQLDFSCDVLNATGMTGIDEWNIGGIDCARNCPASLPVNDPNYLLREQERKECLRDCWAFGKSKKIVTDFVIGVVPITASFEAWGLIGAEVSMDVADSCSTSATPFTFEAHTGPWADLGTEISAGVGSSKLFSAGIGGELNPLLGDTFFATVAVNDLIYDTGTGYVTGSLHEDLTNTLTGPQGRVFCYVGYPCLKICRSWGIPYPCGIRQCKAKQTLVGFKTFVIEDVLFCAEQDFSGPLSLQ